MTEEGVVVVAVPADTRSKYDPLVPSFKGAHQHERYRTKEPVLSTDGQLLPRDHPDIVALLAAQAAAKEEAAKTNDEDLAALIVDNGSGMFKGEGVYGGDPPRQVS